MANQSAADRPLTAQQKKFAELYAAHPDGKKAAIGAGYSPKSAQAQASQLLNHPKVSAYLKTLTQPKQDDRIADAVERQRFWTDVMRGKGRATFVTKEGLDSGAPDWGSRIRAAELLAKAQGDFKDGDDRDAKPNIVINMPQRPMTPAEIEEARVRNRTGD